MRLLNTNYKFIILLDIHACDFKVFKPVKGHFGRLLEMKLIETVAQKRFYINRIDDKGQESNKTNTTWGLPRTRLR